MSRGLSPPSPVACWHAFSYKVSHVTCCSSAPLPPSKLTLLAAVAGCTITRNCSREAYQKMARSVQTSDMLGEIGKVFEKHFGDVGVDEEASKL